MLKKNALNVCLSMLLIRCNILSVHLSGKTPENGLLDRALYKCFISSSITIIIIIIIITIIIIIIISGQTPNCGSVHS